MKNLKWGIAAAGRITHDFVTALGTIDKSKHTVVAVADVEVARAKEFAERHNIPKYYDGFDALSCDDDIDIVYIGTLNPFHYTVAKLMLVREKHVLCEKPLCLSYEEAAELYKLAKSKSVFLMEGMWSKFFPSYQRLSELLNIELIGEVSHISVKHGFRAANIERILTRSLGGSITLDIGLYAIQLGQVVYQCAPVSIKATAQLNHDGVDIECEFTLDYGRNRKLTAYVSGLKNLENDAIIHGSKGDIKLLNYWCCTSIIKPNNVTETWPLPSAKFDFNHTNSCGLRYEAEEVYNCIAKRLIECPLHSHEHSLEMIRIEEEIRKQIGVSYDSVISKNL